MRPIKKKQTKDNHERAFTPAPVPPSIAKCISHMIRGRDGAGFQPNKWKNPRPLGHGGFTILEMVVYIGILSIVVLAVITFIVWLVWANIKLQTIQTTNDSARRDMEIITSELRKAINVYIPTTASNQISLETKSHIPQGETNTFIDFYLCDKKLCLKQESLQPIILTDENVEISDLAFIKIGIPPSAIKIEMTANYKNPNNRPEYQETIHLTNTVSLRSY